MSTKVGIQELDVVELVVEAGRWPAGTRATVLEVYPEGAIVEIADERGHTLDMPPLPWAALHLVRAVDQQRLAV